MRKKTQAQFLEDACAIHGEKYDYSQAIYINSATKLTIICPQHGPFRQIPNAHLKNVGCPSCKGGVRGSLEDFITKAQAVHAETYDYSQVDYTNCKAPLTIICKLHGPFLQSRNVHLRGAKCPKCAGKAVATTEDFVVQATRVHGSLFDYSQTVYTKSNQKLRIICATHGSFEQEANSHLRGTGCPECAREKGKQTSGWGRRKWVARQGGRLALLYVVRMSGHGENFFKIGITLLSVAKRFHGSRTPYAVNIIACFASFDAVSIYNMEVAVKRLSKAFSYSPGKRFGGCRECYSSIDPALAHLTAQTDLQLVS